MYRCKYCGAHLDPHERCDCEYNENTKNYRDNSRFTTNQLMNYQLANERRRLLKIASEAGHATRETL